MAEYRKYEDVNHSWICSYVSDSTCRACNKPVAEMTDAYACTISHYNHKIYVYCPECFAKRTAKTLGDNGEDDGKLIAYEISDVVRATKPLRLKLHVEQPSSAITRALDELDKGEEDTASGRYSGVDCVAQLLWNFSRSLSRMSSGNFRGGGLDPSHYEKHRLKVFVKLAILLRPFLPKISGMMLERLYQKHREEMANKYKTRTELNAWRREQAQRPDRLFPVTVDGPACAKLIVKRFPSGSAAMGGKDSYYTSEEEYKEAVKTLKLTEDEKQRSMEIKVCVFNTGKGPRFIVRY